jgi:hypothetical protein
MEADTHSLGKFSSSKARSKDLANFIMNVEPSFVGVLHTKSKVVIMVRTYISSDEETSVKDSVFVDLGLNMRHI